MCGKYDKGRGIETIFEYHAKKRFLAELAWDEFYLKGRLDITRDSLEVFLKIYTKKYSWDEGSLIRFVAEIERSGLLRFDDKVSFWHRSFLDFFVAFRISERRTEYPTLDKDIVNIYFDDMWTDVAFYYIGIQRELNQDIIAALEEEPSDSFGKCLLKILIGRLLQAGWHTPSQEKIRAIEIGLKNVEEIRHYVDEMLSSSKMQLPTIFSDFIYMAACEYSFGSRTMLAETASICNKLVDSCDLIALRNCLLLLWAQRWRLPEDEKNQTAKQLLDSLVKLEIGGKLTVRDKFVTLFILEQVEKENKEVLRSIKRKIDRTKKLYPGEMQRLLPPLKTKMRLRLRRRRDLS